MNYLFAGLIALIIMITGCSISQKQPAVHDFGFVVYNHGAKSVKNPIITVDAPKWLWDNRIRYRLLYASPTRVRFYTLDSWIAPPPELFEQQLFAGNKTLNYPLHIRLLDFEQQFDAPDRARVVLRFSVDAYAAGNKSAISSQQFRLEQPTTTPDAAGAVNGFANLTRQAVDKIQTWQTGLSDSRI